MPICRPAEYFRHSFSELSAAWTRVRPGLRQPLTEEDTRIHALLNERLAALHHERHGLWPRANRLLRLIARFMLWPPSKEETYERR